MQIHWPLIISTVCQRIGLGTFVFALISNVLFGSGLPLNLVALATLALLAVGGIASVFHLKRPQRFFNAFSNLGSHLTQEALITPFLGIALFVCGFNGFLFDLGSAGGVIELISGALALTFLVCTGLAYQMGSRPAWNTWFVLVLFLLTALEAGGVATLAFCFALNLAVSTGLIICALACILICIAAQIAYVVRMRGVGYGVNVNAFEEPYRMTFMFWLVCGAVLLIVCALLSWLLLSALVAVCALVLAALGIAAWTMLFFKGALKVKMFPMYPVDLNLDM